MRIIGRTKETIIRGGENNFPQAIDDHLQEHPGIIFAQTVPYAHPDLSEEVGAFVVTSDENLGERDVFDHCGPLGSQRRPKYIILLPAECQSDFLCFSGPGKPQRVKNQDLFATMMRLDQKLEELAASGEILRGLSVPGGGEHRIDVVAIVPDGASMTPEELLRQLTEEAISEARVLPASSCDAVDAATRTRLSRLRAAT